MLPLGTPASQLTRRSTMGLGAAVKDATVSELWVFTPARASFSGATRVVIPELLLPRFGFSDEDSGVGPVSKISAERYYMDADEISDKGCRIFWSMLKRDLILDLHQSSGVTRATLSTFPCFPCPTDVQLASQWTAYFALNSLPKAKSAPFVSRRLSATGTRISFFHHRHAGSFVSGTCPAFGLRTGVTDSVAVVAICLGDPCVRASNIYQTVCTPPKYDVKIAVLVVGGGVFPALDDSFHSYAIAVSGRHSGFNDFFWESALR
ncbi:hypothetical protein C8R43DRAFT_943547 [Mycena crocata]|nr:hypothetical protein C8R43DRAFT_943547 [Mycena crocata]